MGCKNIETEEKKEMTKGKRLIWDRLIENSFLLQ